MKIMLTVSCAKPFVGLDGLKNIQRFMKLRSAKIAELNLKN